MKNKNFVTLRFLTMLRRGPHALRAALASWRKRGYAVVGWGFEPSEFEWLKSRRDSLGPENDDFKETEEYFTVYLRRPAPATSQLSAHEVHLAVERPR